MIFDAIVIGLGRGGNKGDIWIGRDGAIRLADRMGPAGEGQPVVTKDGNGGRERENSYGGRVCAGARRVLQRGDGET